MNTKAPDGAFVILRSGCHPCRGGLTGCPRLQERGGGQCGEACGERDHHGGLRAPWSDEQIAQEDGRTAEHRERAEPEGDMREAGVRRFLVADGCSGGCRGLDTGGVPCGRLFLLRSGKCTSDIMGRGEVLGRCTGLRGPFGVASRRLLPGRLGHVAGMLPPCRGRSGSSCGCASRLVHDDAGDHVLGGRRRCAMRSGDRDPRGGAGLPRCPDPHVVLLGHGSLLQLARLLHGFLISGGFHPLADGILTVEVDDPDMGTLPCPATCVGVRGTRRRPGLCCSPRIGHRPRTRRPSCGRCRPRALRGLP